MPTETISLGQVEIRFLLDGNDTGGTMSMFEFLVAPGAKVPVPHYHEAFDEAIYGIAGVLTFTVDGVAHRIGPGDRCFVPRGKVHHFTNNGAEPTRSLAVLTPAIVGPAFFREMGELMKAGGPPDPAKAAAIMRRHGLVAVPLAT
ncbi:MAG TPA: cupin domain-containing protein [Planctomycetaceae bacterium]|nr:cupin domain-containing protein [Planctomycetaceae bacterium]